MWFKQRKTTTLPIEVTVELPKTADGHSLDEMVVCYDCGQLVLKEKAKEVEYRHEGLVLGGYGRPKMGWISSTRHYCQAHTPAWDVIQRAYHETGYHYCRRIPTVPERLEEIVEAPVKVARKRKPKKGAK